MKKKLKVSSCLSEGFHRMFEQQMKLQHDLVAKQEENQTFRWNYRKSSSKNKMKRNQIM